MEYNITYRQKDKGWQYIISRKENGKWKQVKSKQGFVTKKEAKANAEKAILELKVETKKNINILNDDYDTITFKILFEELIKHTKIYKEYSTVKSYENTLSKFKDLHSLKIIDIKRIDIQKCVDKITESGLKSSSIHLYLSKLKLFFNYYKNNYNLNYENPINNITLEKNKDANTKKALTKIELDKLLKNLKNSESEFYIASLIAGTCGLRLGEILGLTWNDLDEVNSTLSINKQWKKLKNDTWGFGYLKSKNSKRIVPVPRTTLTELQALHKKLNVIDITNRIVPLNPYTISKFMNRELHSLADISIHELRHTYATLLIGNGIDFKTAANILGHDIEMTIKTYSHVTTEMLKSAANKIEKIF